MSSDEQKALMQDVLDALDKGQIGRFVQILTVNALNMEDDTLRETIFELYKKHHKEQQEQMRNTFSSEGRIKTEQTCCINCVFYRQHKKVHNGGYCSKLNLTNLVPYHTRADKALLNNFISERETVNFTVEHPHEFFCKEFFSKNVL